jgi:hypothetical protein
MTNDGKLDSADIQIKDEIKNLINKREGMYKSALVITALSKEKAQDSWRNVFTKITLSNKDENVSEKFEYDNFILNKISIPVDEFLKLLDDLILKGDLNVKNCPIIKASGAFEYDSYWRYRSSNDEWLKNEWPMHNYIFKIGDNIRGYSPSGPLISAQYPHFPDALSAIKYYFGFDVQNYSSSIFLFLPNYQLKIDKLTIGSEHLDLKITINGITQEELIGKLYYEKEEHIKTEDFIINENPKSIRIGFIPDIMSIYLLKKGGEVLDFRRSYLKWPSSSKGVNIELKENDVIEMIKQGENQRVEFKQELNRETEKFAMTAVAFANGKGGAILFGIDDHANIVGVKEKIGDSISNSLRSRCEPFIEHEIKTIIIEDNTIVVIRISEGINKPYTLKDKGVYIRRSSTNRIANRFELDEFYEKRKNPDLERGYW